MALTVGTSLGEGRGSIDAGADADADADKEIIMFSLLFAGFKNTSRSRRDRTPPQGAGNGDTVDVYLHGCGSLGDVVIGDIIVSLVTEDAIEAFDRMGSDECTKAMI